MGLIPDEIIAQVIDRCDVVDVISSYIPLKRTGRNFKANCPFHDEKTPSFIVNPDKQIFHCFGCGVGGNVISFVMKQERMEFPEAIRLLARKVNIDIPDTKESGEAVNIRQEIYEVNKLAAQYFHQNLLSDRSSQAEYARDYLKKRRVELKTARQLELGYALDQWDGLIKSLRDQNVSLRLMEQAGLIIPRDEKNGYYDRFRHRVIFPIFDTRGNIRAFGARALDDSPAKYINSPETPVYTKGQHLYGFHLAKDVIGKLDSVVVVEGYMDFISPFQAGIQHVVASLGTALTTEQVRLIRRYTKNVTMLFDTDQAGESAMLRSLDIFIEEGMNVKVASLDEGDDPDQFVHRCGAGEFQKRLDEAAPLFDYKLKVLQKTYDIMTVEGKANISSEMLPTINKFDNEIIKSSYIKRLSQKLGIPESAFWAELKKIAVPRERRQKPAESIESTDHLMRSAESRILKLMMDETNFISTTRHQVDLADFQDGYIRSVISKIYEMFEKGETVNIGSLISHFEDPQTQKFITQLAAQEDVGDVNKEQVYKDCISRLRQDKIKSQRKELLERIRSAEVSGDMNQLEILKKQFNQLTRK